MSTQIAGTQKTQLSDSPLKKMKQLHQSSVSLQLSSLQKGSGKMQQSLISLNQTGKNSPRFSTNENPQGGATISTIKGNTTIQPSRYGLKEKLKPIEYRAQKVLGDLETQVEVIDTVFKKNDPNNKQQQEKINQYKQSIEPIALRIKKPNDFKLKPLRRVESDFQMFKDIFVQPQQARLEQLHHPPPSDDPNNEDQFLDSAEKFFQSSKNEALLLQQQQQQKSLQTSASMVALKSTSDRKGLVKFNQSEAFNLLNNSIAATLKEDLQIKMGNASPNRRKNDQMLANSINNNANPSNSINFNNMSALEQSISPENESTKQFFDQLIQVQPPDLPNATNASPIAPGNGYAPSIPLVSNFDEAGKSVVKDLLVRAKAGQQAGDVQKEAHLSFYLGMVYDNQKKYSKAAKHYLKYYTCARLMGDKIGMGLGANRVGCDYFHIGDYEKSIEFHEKNISYSDSENAFAGYYNLGIAQRKNSRRAEAINNFKICLQWAKDRDEMESECLSLGQLAVTFQEVGDNEQALFHFTVIICYFFGHEDCYEISKKLKKVKLQLDCLMHITKLLSLTAMKNSDNSIRVLRDAVDCARILDDKKTASLCLCNLGIMEGNKAYEGVVEGNNFKGSVEDWDDDDEEFFATRQQNQQRKIEQEQQEQLQKQEGEHEKTEEVEQETQQQSL